MARRKNNDIKASETEKDMPMELSINNEKIKEESVVIKEDNPFSKKVKSVIENVEHNRNNEILSDSDLIGNIII